MSHCVGDVLVALSMEADVCSREELNRTSGFFAFFAKHGVPRCGVPCVLRREVGSRMR